jgi:hypothetical protein
MGDVAYHGAGLERCDEVVGWKGMERVSERSEVEAGMECVWIGRVWIGGLVELYV